MSETIRELISEEDVDKRIRELGEQISRDLRRKADPFDLCPEGRRVFSCVSWRSGSPFRFPWILCAWEATETGRSRAA